MNGGDFDHFRQLVRARSGLVLSPEKGYLVQSRLSPIAQSDGFAGVAELLAQLHTSPREALV